MSRCGTCINRSLAVLAVLILIAPAGAAWVVNQVPLQPGWGDPDESVEVHGINSNGVVCGSGNYQINVSATPFRYDGTTVTELPLLPSPYSPLALTTAINADEVVCGYGYDALGRIRAIFWEDTTAYTIPYPVDANTNASMKAYDINDSGVIIGYFYNDYTTNGSSQSAFYFKDGVSYNLDPAIRAAGLEGAQIPRDVNNRNVVCGGADDALGIQNAWTYDIDTGLVTVIGRMGAGNCGANAINEDGVILTRCDVGGFHIYKAVIYDGTWHVVDADEIRSQWVRGMNDHGRTVGTVYIGSNNRATWISDAPGSGSMIPVEIPTWESVNVYAINNSGQMGGFGRPPGAPVFEQRGFVLTPPPGDADHDGDIDLDDYIGFAVCLSGPQNGVGFETPSAPCLDAFDFAPADGDVDLADFDAFQRVSREVSSTSRVAECRLQKEMATVNRRTRKTSFSVTVVFLVLTVPASAAWGVTETPNPPAWVGDTEA